ncbi:hypothetical protein [Cerasicoccus fimbriatus]|uniref:hypothetical protein n=1 Tax=Cerasicoccus fimbriatus TaxID=3014554 RepID=UPI0022B525AB|nr:hypothetical protein [Cerasicoccus sp. TK19100]
MAKGNPYKLAAKGASLVEHQRVYFGDDHLLIVDGKFTEVYRRLYYKDIQALQRHNTSTSIWVQMFFLVVIILSLIGLGSGMNAPNWGAMYLLVPSSVFLAYSIYCGRSCALGIKTQVQQVRLVGVGAMRKAVKFEKQLTERITAVQGTLTAEALQAANRGESTANV